MRDVSSSIINSPRPSLFGPKQTALHVVLDEPAHPTELAQRVEVADERHVGVGVLARLAAEHGPSGAQLGDVDAD